MFNVAFKNNMSFFLWKNTPKSVKLQWRRFALNLAESEITIKHHVPLSTVIIPFQTNHAN